MTQEVLDSLQIGTEKGENRSSVLSLPPDREIRGGGTDTQEAAAHPAEKAEAREEIAEAATQPELRRERTGEKAPDTRMLREHLAALQEQAAQIPGFDLSEAMRDPAFVRLTAPGVGVPVADAWYALHREETERRQQAENREALARAAAAASRRPREGGGIGPAVIASDYRSMSRAEQLRIKQRIREAGARGEKLYP